MTSQCTTCKEVKPSKEFSVRKDRPKGHVSACKQCSALKKVLYRRENNARWTAMRRAYYAKNKESIQAARKTAWFREKRNKKLKEERKENPEKFRERQRKQYYKDPLKVIKKNNRYAAKRRKEDVYFRMIENMRKRVHYFLFKNKTRRVKDFGCTKEELIRHMESRFEKGMTWENYGRKGWHIDHIYPLSKVDFTKEEEIKRAFHYTNLQPLWASDNYKKSNKVWT